jgi:predicted HicB family RNase H-like nuclease
MNVLHYKGFIGSIEADPTTKCLHGKLLYIHDLVTYEAITIATLETEFKKSVKEYIATCKELKREPMRPFKGSLNVRIGPELHKEAALHAKIDGMTLNEFIRMAIQNMVYQENIARA